VILVILDYLDLPLSKINFNHMLPDNLKALLKLISQTGDRLIIYDPGDQEKTFVLMDIENYQKMLSRRESDVFNTLANNSSKQAEIPLKTQEFKKESENLTEEDLTDKINREISMWKNGGDKPYAAEEDSPRKAWQISAQVKDRAQEIES
jgi:hypothetical protein